MRTSSKGSRRRIAAGLVGVALALSGCGGDDDDAAASDTTPSSEPGTSSTSSGTEAPPADLVVDGVVEVALVDFAFEGLPAVVPAGTRLAVTNTSAVELHKLSAHLLPAAEGRSTEELLALPAAELAEVLGARPATVLAAGPGGSQLDEVGDGTLSAPGRYVLLCAVPLGLDPDGYLDAAPPDRRAQIREGDQLHFTLGMFADLLVE